MVREDVGSHGRVYLRWMHRLHCACVGRSPQHDGNRILRSATESPTTAKQVWTSNVDRTMEQELSDELEKVSALKVAMLNNQILSTIWQRSDTSLPSVRYLPTFTNTYLTPNEKELHPPTCLTTVTHTTKYFINLWKILQSLLNYDFIVVDNL